MIKFIWCTIWNCLPNHLSRPIYKFNSSHIMVKLKEQVFCEEIFWLFLSNFVFHTKVILLVIDHWWRSVGVSIYFFLCLWFLTVLVTTSTLENLWPFGCYVLTIENQCIKFSYQCYLFNVLNKFDPWCFFSSSERLRWWKGWCIFFWIKIFSIIISSESENKIDFIMEGSI